MSNEASTDQSQHELPPPTVVDSAEYGPGGTVEHLATPQERRAMDVLRLNLQGFGPIAVAPDMLAYRGQDHLAAATRMSEAWNAELTRRAQETGQPPRNFTFVISDEGGAMSRLVTVGKLEAVTRIGGAVDPERQIKLADALYKEATQIATGSMGFHRSHTRK